MISQHLIRSFKAGISLGIMLVLAACAPTGNRFIGTWFAPTDQSHVSITEKDVVVSGPSVAGQLHLRYILRSPNELAVMTDKGQIGMVLDISTDGNTLQANAQAPFGIGSYVMQREK